MTSRTAFALLTAVGTAGALVLGTLETSVASAFWHARPGLEPAGTALLVLTPVALLTGTVGLVVAQVRLRRTPALDSPQDGVRGAAWTGWVLLGVAAAFAVVCAAASSGALLIELDGGCEGWCGLLTALAAAAAGVVASVLAAVGCALLWWSSRAARRTVAEVAPWGHPAGTAVRCGR